MVVVRNPVVERGVPTDCCPRNAPEVVTAEFSTQSPDCLGLAGRPIRMAWIDKRTRWEGRGSFGYGRTISLHLACAGDDCSEFQLTYSISGCHAAPRPIAPVSCVCAPFSLEFAAQIPLECCNGQQGRDFAIEFVLTE